MAMIQVIGLWLVISRLSYGIPHEILSYNELRPNEWSEEEFALVEQSIVTGFQEQPIRDAVWYEQNCSNLTMRAQDFLRADFNQYKEMRLAIICHQNPPDCRSASYVVYHHVRSQSGFGWGSFIEMTHLFWAIENNRILVEYGEMGGYKEGIAGYSEYWRWCPVGSKSHACFFESWSRCTREVSNFANEDFAHNTDSTSNLDPQKKIWHVKDLDMIGDWNRYYNRNGPGFFWYMALMSNILYKPLPWVVKDAVGFLHRVGINPREGLIVAHIRWGGKVTEVPLVPLQSYFGPIKALAECLSTRHVLIQSETQKAISDLLEWCSQQNLHCIFTPNPRTGQDVWNPSLVAANQNSLSQERLMLREAFIAVRNYVIGSYGVGYTGTLHSAWVKIQMAIMLSKKIDFHSKLPSLLEFKPPVVIGLQNQRFTLDNAYTEKYSSYIVDDYSNLTWKCPL
eukprot:TRINITY_DN3155_c0_g1_i1.p1 TRINITY_DN3155_c0_g1~~TRINITY_DN3155_c0_g1_i1.p1  ORF type:complete len:453 (-),score=26.64 TRINITY_DN3155_c0_g1_i1:440-1798(-)